MLLSCPQGVRQLLSPSLIKIAYLYEIILKKPKMCKNSNNDVVLDFWGGGSNDTVRCR